MKVVLFVLILFISFSLSYECYKYEYFHETKGCIFCPSGHYCPGDDKKHLCPDGYYSHKLDGKCSKCGCDGCLKEDVIDNVTKEVIHYAGSCPNKSPCYPGYGISRFTGACDICQRGHYSKGGFSRCELCPTHKIAREEGQSECEECPPNQGIIGVHEGCEICQEGYYFEEEWGMCSMCENDTITNKINQTECIPCGKGKRANHFHTECLPDDECVDEDEEYEKQRERDKYLRFHPFGWGLKEPKHFLINNLDLDEFSLEKILSKNISNHTKRNM